MRVQAIAKSGGLWMPWRGDLPEGATIELDVFEVVPNSAIDNIQNNSDEFPVLYALTNILSPDENIAEFRQITDALFGESYCYVPEKSDQEILAEVLSEKYV